MPGHPQSTPAALVRPAWDYTAGPHRGCGGRRPQLGSGNLKSELDWL